MPRVMVIDDETDLRNLVKEWFEFTNFEVFGFGTATEGISSLDTINPDAIILDLMLPDMDGYSALAIIMKMRPDIPIVVYTAYALSHTFESMKANALALGASAFFPKPFEPSELLAEVCRLVE